MSKYYILNTKEESDQCRLDCYHAYIATIPDGVYKNQTTSWSPEEQRLTDNKYIVPECKWLKNHTYHTEVSESNWFPEEEDPAI
jgi:hypothetical protein